MGISRYFSNSSTVHANLFIREIILPTVIHERLEMLMQHWRCPKFMK